MSTLVTALNVLTELATARPVPPPANIVDLDDERRKRAPPSTLWLQKNGYFAPAPLDALSEK